MKIEKEDVYTVKNKGTRKNGMPFKEISITKNGSAISCHTSKEYMPLADYGVTGCILVRGDEAAPGIFWEDGGGNLGVIDEIDVKEGAISSVTGRRDIMNISLKKGSTCTIEQKKIEEFEKRANSWLKRNTISDISCV